MNIAILETGSINADIADRFSRYPDMFRKMFADAGSTGITFSEVPVLDGVFPASVDDYDGYLVTGSAAGVYDDFDWIDPLKAFIRDIHAAGKPLVGVCFGHQIIAQALGGTCIKWPGGWGVGQVIGAISEQDMLDAEGKARMEAHGAKMLEATIAAEAEAKL